MQQRNLYILQTQETRGEGITQQAHSNDIMVSSIFVRYSLVIIPKNFLITLLGKLPISDILLSNSYTITYFVACPFTLKIKVNFIKYIYKQNEHKIASLIK